MHRRDSANDAKSAAILRQFVLAACGAVYVIRQHGEKQPIVRRGVRDVVVRVAETIGFCATGPWVDILEQTDGHSERNATNAVLSVRGNPAPPRNRKACCRAHALPRAV